MNNSQDNTVKLSSVSTITTCCGFVAPEIYNNKSTGNRNTGALIHGSTTYRTLQESRNTTLQPGWNSLRLNDYNKNNNRTIFPRYINIGTTGRMDLKVSQVDYRQFAVFRFLRIWVCQQTDPMSTHLCSFSVCAIEYPATTILETFAPLAPPGDRHRTIYTSGTDGDLNHTSN